MLQFRQCGPWIWAHSESRKICKTRLSPERITPLSTIPSPSFLLQPRNSSHMSSPFSGCNSTCTALVSYRPTHVSAAPWAWEISFRKIGWSWDKASMKCSSKSDKTERQNLTASQPVARSEPPFPVTATKYQFLGNTSCPTCVVSQQPLLGHWVKQDHRLNGASDWPNRALPLLLKNLTIYLLKFIKLFTYNSPKYGVR